MSFRQLSSTDHLPSYSQPMSASPQSMPSSPPPVHHLSRNQTRILLSQQANLYDVTVSDVEAAPPQTHERLPAYMEQDMDEPLPTYMQAVRHKMRQAVQYPAQRMPSKKARYGVMVMFMISLLIIVAVPIAATRGNGWGNSSAH